MADSAESAPALKEIFNRERLRHIARETEAVWPDFDQKALSETGDGWAR